MTTETDSVQGLLREFPKGMSLADRVNHWNKVFPQYPMTVYDKDWIYGVWYCGTSFQKSTYYGQYPPSFLKRVLALFPDKTDIMQLCAGTVKQDITVDMKAELKPVVCADAQNLPFKPESFDLTVFDPPYSKRDAEQYYGTPYLSVQKVMRQVLPILRVGGFFCVLDVRYPSYPRSQGWKLVGLICIVTGFSKATRILAIFLKEKPNNHPKEAKKPRRKAPLEVLTA